MDFNENNESENDQDDDEELKSFDQINRESTDNFSDKIDNPNCTFLIVTESLVIRNDNYYQIDGHQISIQ